MEKWKIIAIGTASAAVIALLLRKTMPVSRPALAAVSQPDGSWPTSTRPYAFLTYASNRVNVTGLHPIVLPRFLAMAQEYTAKTKKKLLVNSGLRSSTYQKVLYDRDLASNQTPLGQSKKIGVASGFVARPNSSPHERGLAIDVNSAQASELDRLGLIKKYGFDRPLWPKGRAKVTEEWHIQIRPDFLKVS